MSSAHELWARIAQISDSIEGHKQAIRDLEIQQCAIKSELNTVLDLMARLPFEMVSDIFFQSTPNAEAASVLLAVCRSWSHIALATPSLWTTISNLGVPDAAFTNLLFSLWLQRGQNLPISLSMGPWKKFSDQDIDLLVPCLHRLQKLDISIDSEGDMGYIPYLHGFPMKALTHLTAHAMGEAEIDPNHPEDLLDIMRNAPNLVEFDMYRTSLDRLAMDFRGVLTHTSLRDLRFGKLEDGDGGLLNASPAMLSQLTLPSLQTLHFFSTAMHFEDMEMLLAFLTRSSPPLLSLQFGSYLGDEHGEIMVACLRLVPTLTSLSVLALAPDLLDILIHAPDLLPALVNLKIRGDIGDRTEFPRVLSVLTQRRTSLRDFQLLVIYEPAEKFEGFEHVAVAFRQLAAESGMRIYIGTREKNLLD
ncbi:hypothetical protein FB45DRAFT_1055940 [Roridomyces roridus]|uniref:F-box domain-containing protein n=1 Tax=Roridomyces roridus TaxID=1738132 RepID=A0AAD7FTG5_9AGAR|nr:hypothetical protein FB45DRAFT_1055940 [Roridomyces roridus]